MDFWEHSEQLGALGVWGKGKRGKWVVGWGVWQPLSALSALSARMIRKCGGGGWGFFVGGLGFFCKFAEMYVFFEKEIIEIFLII